MPKRTTTAAITLLSNDRGRVQLALNAAAAPGGSVVEWSVDWGDGEVEDGTLPLPTTATHSYVNVGAVLAILTVKDSKGKVVSEGMNLAVQPVPVPIPPEPGTLDAKIPPSDTGVLFAPRDWQYQQMSAPLLVTVAPVVSPNGTKIVAPTGRIVAPDESVWTWGVNTGLPVGQHYALRNGVNTSGYGTVLKLCDGLVYLLGSDGKTWYRYDKFYADAGTLEPCAGTRAT